MTKSKLLQQIQLIKIRDQLDMYLAEKDGLMDARMSHCFHQIMKSYDYLESLINHYGSVQR